MHLILQGQTAEPLEFFMVLASDGKTGATGLSPTVTISKNGGSFASPAGAVSEIGSGWYKVAGNATDSDTLGVIKLHATAGTADPCDREVAQVVLCDPRTNATQTGNAFTRLGAPAGASLAADIAAIFAKATNLPADPADASDIAALFATLNTVLVSTGVALTSAERTAIATAVLTTAGTEAYRADGAAPTLMQALCEILAHLGEASVSGTTMTLKRFDGSTTAMTLTLNDASSPTSITRAS